MNECFLLTSVEIRFCTSKLQQNRCNDIYCLGLRNRQVRAHCINDHSSRSHCMLTLSLDSETVSSYFFWHYLHFLIGAFNMDTVETCCLAIFFCDFLLLRDVNE